MIPDRAFEARLKAYDKALFVRWEYYRDEGDGLASCAPYAGPAIRQIPESYPASGRFSIYHRDRQGRAYKVFDVAYPDGGFHPLDSRVISALRYRDSAWDRVDREIEEGAKKKLDSNKVKNDSSVAGPVSEGLEIAYRTGTGLKQFALGQPGAPAVKNSGHYTVVDRRRNF